MKNNLLILMLTALPLMSAPIWGCAERPQTDAEAVERSAVEIPETNYYEIRTPLGRMVIRLFDETPRHRDNFKRLVEEQAYDSTLFHRIIDGFMIQGGDPNSLDDNLLNDGQGGPGYTIPPEFRADLFHRRGALAAARQGDQVNPNRESSGSQFYIVDGTVYPDSILTLIEQQLRQQIPDPAFAFSDSARAIYTTDGGTPNLDGMYTVFGELVEGYEVLDAIASTATARSTNQRVRRELIDRPLEPVWMIVRPLPDYEPPTPTEQ